MFDAAFIVLRELAELLFITAAVLSCLTRSQRGELAKLAIAGAASGAVMGTLLVWAIADGPLSTNVEGLLSLGLGTATLWLSLSMLYSSQSIEAHIDNRLQALLASRGASLLVFGYCTFSSLREFLELGVFLRAASLTDGFNDVLIGAGLGAVTVLLAAMAFRSIWDRLRLRAIFRFSTVVLCFVSVELLLGGMLALLEAAASDSTPLIAALDGMLGMNGWSVSSIALALTAVPALLLLRRWWREAA